MKVLCVVGARPNFMKVAPITRALDGAGVPRVLVHTEQHHDDALSGVFFRELGLPAPDVSLGVGSGTHAEQTAKVMLAFEPVIDRERPSCVVVVGDVNSTVACALTAAKAHVPVVHVEAGLRSGDREMPEEINRIVTDAISDLLLTPSVDADENLKREGIEGARVMRVGNVMIDTLAHLLPAARARGTLARLELAPRGYALATLHRPSNVDTAASLGRTLEALQRVAEEVPVVFPAHPRTRERLEQFGLRARLEGTRVRVTEPVGYLDCVALQDEAALVLTDSGGIQEETTFLGVPCLTMRDTTERPVTITCGTNRLVGTAPEDVHRAAREILATVDRPRGRVPALWDGHTAERIVDGLSRYS
jgi:UDP-N-acetylglucosamine 2-epimerase (non-hydrolysing)